MKFLFLVIYIYGQLILQYLFNKIYIVAVIYKTEFGNMQNGHFIALWCEPRITSLQLPMYVAGSTKGRYRM